MLIHYQGQWKQRQGWLTKYMQLVDLVRANRWVEAARMAAFFQRARPTTGRWCGWAMELAGHITDHRYSEASSHDVGVAAATALCSMQPCSAVAPRSPNNIG